ncbi:MAG: glycogen/starch synthase [Tannerellaceae bacterium]|jgi:glycosyltransferase involved in cell wall biosynthesis|nr:glycogen/starch synthase [Tannerellaceae bacterium]
MKETTNNPLPYNVFESSWEVCNKVGGIYTVLSTKAATLQKRFGGRLIFIGPELGQDAGEFSPDDDNTLIPWQLQAAENFPLPVRVGRWNVPGHPLAVLVDFERLRSERDALYYEMWRDYGLDSLQGSGDYDDSCLFAVAAAQVMESIIRFSRFDPHRTVVHFNEWTLGMGLLYLRQRFPEVATLFTTHATTVGRSIAGNNKPLYDYLDLYHGDQMAAELQVTTKHSVEKLAAHHADCFTTVSELTARECTQLLGKTPDMVTPNGFEPTFVPAVAEYKTRRVSARERLRRIASLLTGTPLPEDTLLIATGGRYEYRNKGLDLFVQSMKLVGERIRYPAVAFIAVPAWSRAARADLRYALDEEGLSEGKALQCPFVTHWLHDMENDPLLAYIHQSGFCNSEADKLKIIFIPSYLDGKDGIVNLPYYDFLSAMDLTVYPSYYEPWGYTPLESIAFGIPTVTTNLSGFGLWAAQYVDTSTVDEGVAVVKRTDGNYFEAAQNIADQVLRLASKNQKQLSDIRYRCKMLAATATWQVFIGRYLDAYRIALARNNQKGELLSGGGGGEKPEEEGC